ncbi:hypothetical protein V1477_006365 [Vespula maculifrons]|uniref:Uncharacterized protein n=1 Tax=Vespula maculifrons TaxID=7453 RepID=A0ABD2CL95_VESMC
MELRKKKFFFNNFFLRNYTTYENRTRVSGKGPSRPLRPYFLRTDRANRSRYLGEPNGTYENRTLINGKDTSRPLRPHFFRPDRTNRSRAITHLGEPNGGHWKGLVAPSKPIFFAYRSDEQEPSYNAIAPRRTGPGSFERARPALYAHIFCVQIGPIGAEL